MIFADDVSRSSRNDLGLKKKKDERGPEKGGSALVSRNVTIGAHRTSVRLEPDMWNGLQEICRREHISLHDVATIVAVRKPQASSLTAALRVFVMSYFRTAATEDGHSRAGHGPGGNYIIGLLHETAEGTSCQGERMRRMRVLEKNVPFPRRRVLHGF